MVTVEDGPGLVASDLHGHPLGHTAVDHVADSGPAEIVPEHLQESLLRVCCQLGHPFLPLLTLQVFKHGLQTCRLPRLAEVLDALPLVLAVEVGEQVRDLPPRGHFQQ
ncbi:MAG: hypothetical protein NTW68_13545 [candidate division NC10 bacterium]|nr:hypothetical protein [candidate division NC10 bacterium]